MSIQCIYSLNGPPPVLFSYETIHHFNLVIQTVIDRSVIVQVIIYNRSLSLRRHLKASLLTEGREGVMDIQLTSLCCGPQGTEAWGCPRDVHIVVVVRWGMWVRMGWDWGLLLLGRRCAPGSPGTGGDPAGGGRHLIFCNMTQMEDRINSFCKTDFFLCCYFYTYSTFLFSLVPSGH